MSELVVMVGVLIVLCVVLGVVWWGMGADDDPPPDEVRREPLEQFDRWDRT